VNATIEWTGLAVIAIVLALIALGIRSAPAGVFGGILKVVLGVVAALILGVMVWNTAVLFMHRTR
jgi:hypothetical protein